MVAVGGCGVADAVCVGTGAIVASGNVLVGGAMVAVGIGASVGGTGVGGTVVDGSAVADGGTGVGVSVDATPVGGVAATVAVLKRAGGIVGTAARVGVEVGSGSDIRGVTAIATMISTSSSSTPPISERIGC